MISKPDDDEKHLIFRALVRMIETNSGTGFHNLDQGHPAYAMGKSGNPGMGDTPERNRLFKLLASFDRKYHDEGPDLSTWQKFCAFAFDAYTRATAR